MQKGIIIAVSVMAMAFFAAAGIETAWAKAQETCPIMGGKIDKSIYADANGKRVYFCCKGCVDPFNKEPEKYIKKLEGEGAELEKTPAAPQKAK